MESLSVEADLAKRPIWENTRPYLLAWENFFDWELSTLAIMRFSRLTPALRRESELETETMKMEKIVQDWRVGWVFGQQSSARREKHWPNITVCLEAPLSPRLTAPSWNTLTFMLMNMNVQWNTPAHVWLHSVCLVSSKSTDCTLGYVLGLNLCKCSLPSEGLIL